MKMDTIATKRPTLHSNKSDELKTTYMRCEGLLTGRPIAWFRNAQNAAVIAPKVGSTLMTPKRPNLTKQTTETTSDQFMDTHNWSVGELVDGILEEQASGISAVQNARKSISDAIEATVERLNRGGRMVFVGAGTSGRIAAQDATELLPTYNWPTERAIVLMAGGTKALYSAVEGAEDDTDAAEEKVLGIAPTKNDTFVGVAASGSTPYTLKCLEVAKRHESFTIGVFNNKDSKMAQLVECPILLKTGAEFVSGSTRMKAGTSQKVVLNTITTTVMIRLGRVYRGQMVDMPVTNKKLTARCIRIVSMICKCEAETAETALNASGWSIKLAIIMVAKDKTHDEAQSALASADGLLRVALEA